MIVVDTNILAYFYLPGIYTTAAEELYEHDPEWVAPILWRSEFRNLLTGYLRRQDISFDEAVALQAEAEFLLGGNEFEVESKSVFQLVNNSNCSAYDCEFIALAIKLNTKVITMDKKVLQDFPDSAINLIDYNSQFH
jgi:predicted nucleic acid-binding protein